MSAAEQQEVFDLIKELVSISSCNLEQEELERRNAKSEIMQSHINGVFDDLKNLNVRCEQFNDVKHSIKQMNDLIRDDLFKDFGTIATMIRMKLDEVRALNLRMLIYLNINNLISTKKGH